jgi:hypothetical protein
MWESISSLAAVASLLVSVAALFISIVGTRSSTKISSEALETARQANDIALGRIRDPAVVEFAFSDKERFSFDFTRASPLAEELKHIVTINNVGKANADGLAFEAIGIVPLTFLTSDPHKEIKPLPSTSLAVPFRSMLRPGGIAHVDVRKLFLQYLAKLEPQLSEKGAVYSTVINIVIDPKALTDPIPSGAPSHLTKNDRRFATVLFSPSVLLSEEARRVLAEADVPHRVYGP